MACWKFVEVRERSIVRHGELQVDAVWCREGGILIPKKCLPRWMQGRDFVRFIANVLAIRTISRKFDIGL